MNPYQTELSAKEFYFRSCPFCDSTPTVTENVDSVSIKCPRCNASIPSAIYRGKQAVGETDVARMHKVELMFDLSKRWNGGHKLGNGQYLSVRVQEPLQPYYHR